MIGEETCTICLNEFEDDEQCHCLDECNHKFHTKCIISWFRTASTCPNCRDNTKDMVNQIHLRCMLEQMGMS